MSTVGASPPPPISTGGLLCITKREARLPKYLHDSGGFESPGVNAREFERTK